MRIICQSGYFKFIPDGPTEIARFASFYRVTLEQVDDHYTFFNLSVLPNYAIKGSTYGGLPVNTTWEGEPWEIMKRNGFVYSIATRRIVPVSSINSLSAPFLSVYYFVADAPLIQPGSFNQGGNRLMSYDSFFDLGLKELRVIGFRYE